MFDGLSISWYDFAIESTGIAGRKKEGIL